MLIADTQALITYFLDHIVDVGQSGSSDTTMRARALGVAQARVNQYWEQPWKIKETSAAISFSGDDGIAELPVNFASWDKNFGWVAFSAPSPATRIRPSEFLPSEIMTLRQQYPTRTGPVEAAVVHGGVSVTGTKLLYRWPTTLNGVTAEAAQAFYYRKPPNLLDQDPPEDEEDPVDEFYLIPTEDQHVIIDGMRAAWDSNSGDGREAKHDMQFRKRVAELFRSRNLDQQPTHLGRPFRAPGGYQGPIIGDRYWR